jgi:hypothetical protein
MGGADCATLRIDGETVIDLRRQLYPFGDDRASVPGRRDVDHFLVTSWGHSGSIWLAGSLNLHDAVCATVGIDNPIECFRFYSINRDPADVTRHAGHALSRHGFSTWNSWKLQLIRDLPGMEAVDAIARDHESLPAYVFDELDLLPGAAPYAVVGNVHGVTLEHLYRVVNSQPDVFRGRRVLLLDLIRHPIGRTESAINATITHHLEALSPRIDAFVHEHAAECLELERRYGLDFAEPRARAALHVFRQGLQNDVWAYELRQYPDVHRIMLEPLQNTPEYFAHVFATVAQGRATPDQQYLDKVYSPDNLGSGRQSTTRKERPPAARAQWEIWSDFERDEFARVAQRLSLAAAYFPFGYDLSFVAPAGKGRAWFESMLDSASPLD